MRSRQCVYGMRHNTHCMHQVPRRNMPASCCIQLQETTTTCEHQSLPSAFAQMACMRAACANCGAASQLPLRTTLPLSSTTGRPVIRFWIRHSSTSSTVSSGLQLKSVPVVMISPTTFGWLVRICSGTGFCNVRFRCRHSKQPPGGCQPQFNGARPGGKVDRRCALPVQPPARRASGCRAKVPPPVRHGTRPAPAGTVPLMM